MGLFMFFSMCSTRREKGPPDVVRIQYFVHELGDGEWSGNDHPNTGMVLSTDSQHVSRHSFFKGRSYSSQVQPLREIAAAFQNVST